MKPIKEKIVMLFIIDMFPPCLFTLHHWPLITNSKKKDPTNHFALARPYPSFTHHPTFPSFLSLSLYFKPLHSLTDSLTPLTDSTLYFAPLPSPHPTLSLSLFFFIQHCPIPLYELFNFFLFLLSFVFVVDLRPWGKRIKPYSLTTYLQQPVSTLTPQCSD